MKLLGGFLLLVSISANAWNPFGPKNYDECILQSMKGVQSEQAANAVIASCSNKFSASKPTRDDPRRGVKLCKVYWDGWKIVLGDRLKVPGFATFSVAYEGVKTVEFSIPEAMEKEFAKRSGGRDKNTDDFFKSHLETIMSLCSDR